MTHPPVKQDDIQPEPKPGVVVDPGFFKTCVLAIAVMLPWPVIGLAVDHFYLQTDMKDPFFMLIGGLTLFILLPIMFVFDITNDLFLQISSPLVWLLIAGVPSYLMSRQPRRRISIIWMLVVLSGISFIQAALAMLGILTINI